MLGDKLRLLRRIGKARARVHVRAYAYAASAVDGAQRTVKL